MSIVYQQRADAPPRKTRACRLCGVEGLHWVSEGQQWDKSRYVGRLRWYLADEGNTRHVCNEYPKPVAKVRSFTIPFTRTTVTTTTSPKGAK